MRKSLIAMIVLAAGTLALAQAPATRPATQPAAADPQVQALLEKLGDADWKARDEAQHKLASMGADVIPTVQAFIKRTQDVEARTRAEAIIRMIRENDTSGPTLITLHVKDTEVEDVLAELSKQAKVKLGVWPEKKFRNNNPMKVTIDVDRKPFWEVIALICDQHGLWPDGNHKQDQITLMNRGTPWGKHPMYTSGPVIVTAVSASRNLHVDFANPQNVNRNSFQMTLAAYVDPKFKPTRGMRTVQLAEAVDDKGNSLIQGAAGPNQPLSTGWGNALIWDLGATLVWPKEPGQRIAKLRGATRFEVEVKTDTWEIENALAAKDLERVVPFGKLTVKDVRKVDARNYSVRIAMEYPQALFPNEAPIDYSSLQRSMDLQDAKGRSFRSSGGGGGGGGGKLEYEFRFWGQEAGGGEDGAVGDPAKLIWRIPLETKEIVVPFEFTDLPLP